MSRFTPAALALSLVLALPAVAPAQDQEMATDEEAIVRLSAETAEFTEMVPGVSKVILWGDHETGPYGAFTRFAPGQDNGLHTHTSDVRIVVLEGAYVYTLEGGEEVRVEAGEFVSMPGGTVHVSGGDAEAGALFYEASDGGFDLNPVDW